MRWKENFKRQIIFHKEDFDKPKYLIFTTKYKLLRENRGIFFIIYIHI
jgi:hypothetical protein